MSALSKITVKYLLPSASSVTSCEVCLLNNKIRVTNAAWKYQLLQYENAYGVLKYVLWIGAKNWPLWNPRRYTDLFVAMHIDEASIEQVFLNYLNYITR